MSKTIIIRLILSAIGGAVVYALLYVSGRVEAINSQYDGFTEEVSDSERGTGI